MSLITNKNYNQRESVITSGTKVSNVNKYTIVSDRIEIDPISINFNRRLVVDIVNNIFDESKGTCEISSSQCSSLNLVPSEYSYDKRLKYWKNALKERSKITNKMTQQIKRKPANILYNRLATIDERNKQTVKRLIDYAERMNPQQLSVKQKAILPEKYGPDICRPIYELQETLPKAERDKKYIMEISGLPQICKEELLGKRKYQGCEKSFNWLKSKYLQKRIMEVQDDVERVIEYYPDVENLQIVGESLTKLQKHDSDIQMISSEQICQISTDTMDENICPCPVTKIEPPPMEYGVKINDYIISSNQTLAIEENFACFPFEREVKKVLTIQNIGVKVLNFDWRCHSYYNKNSSLLKSVDNEFVFDNSSFRLYGGETQDVLVMFQPRRVKIVKCKWMLKIQPTCYNPKQDGVAMKLCGVCSAAPEYEHKLNEIQNEVIEKSNLQMMRKLTTGLGSLIPDLKPIEQICPYQRALNEMELFEQLNPGFKCERYQDLELLRDLYQRVKKPREKAWNLKVDSLKYIILRVREPEARALYFYELSSILDSLKGKCLDLETRILENPERNRSRLLYVRGIICSSIDEWEEITLTLEEAFLKTSMQVFKDEQAKLEIARHLENEEAEEAAEEEGDINFENDKEMSAYVMENRVRKLKAFRDSLYMQTYTMMCNFVENIVNIIEATVVV